MKPIFRLGIIIRLVFVFLSVGSAVYLIGATVNYNHLYPAIGQLNAQVATVTVVKGSVPEQTRLIVRVVLGNPSDYSGFKLADVSVRLSRPLSNQSQTFFAQTESVGGNVFVNSVLGSRASQNTNVTVLLPAQNATFLYNLDPASIVQLAAHVIADCDIVTFLDPVIGRIPVEASEDIFLSV
jgi:hypothetical protein